MVGLDFIERQPLFRQRLNSAIFRHSLNVFGYHSLVNFLHTVVLLDLKKISSISRFLARSLTEAELTLFTRPDSLLRLWRYINHLLTYLLITNFALNFTVFATMTTGGRSNKIWLPPYNWLTRKTPNGWKYIG